MLKEMRNKKRESGAVTIEATISLTAFLFMFMMIFSVITICRAQAHIQIAINATAKELSQYSYLYGLTGLDESLNKFQNSADASKDKIDGTIENVANVFSSLKSINTNADDLLIQPENDLDPETLNQAMTAWKDVEGKLKSAGTSAESVKNDLEAYAENPQELLFGMARILGSEGLELGKSRLIAEPICRALVKKHLKRHNDDTAEDFCKSVGIVPGTYLGKETYFNGMDFSNSTLFLYGSDEINIVVTYKVRVLPLLPIDYEFTITQSALTKGWLHGDKTVGAETATSDSAILAAIEKDEGSLWNSPENWGLIKSKIVSAEVDNLKTGSYYGISGETLIHAYDPSSNTVARVEVINPLYGLDSINDVDKEQLKKDLEKYASALKSVNSSDITVRKLDENGNYVKQTFDVSKGTNKKVVVVIPQDEGLKTLMEDIVKEMGSDMQFEFKEGHGKVFTELKEGGES